MAAQAACGRLNESCFHALVFPYRPLNCHRHTEGEIRAWCEKAGLGIERLNDQESGFTVVAKKF